MSGHEEERLARAALSRLSEPGEPRLSSLVAQLGPVVLRDRLLEGRGSDGLQDDVATRLAACDPVAELERADHLGLRFVIPGDEEWPTQLDDLAAVEPLHRRGGVPVGLWVRGPLRLHELRHPVAVVGSRSATTYGTAVAAEIAAIAGREGYAVVSGAAYGIDHAAHRGAVSAEGPSVAVLACGADRVYPVAHRAMLEFLAAEGAVVSEAPPGCAPTRIRFLSRNRLIAALAEGTVVVEAAVRSGALNTATWTSRLNRHLMGVPGPVTSASSQGVHELVRSGAATLVTSGADVLDVLGAVGEHLVQVPRARERARDRLTRRQQQVLDAVPLAQGAPVDSVARTAGIALLEVQTALAGLERGGYVERDEDGWRLAALAHD
ncbi:DNA-processing protein DprA [Nocardioides sp. zg-DK7169]|uniref:DNA-processing protein DprA n=1 Tax=Nocardioides sp. zg-DK7169 TaxID=2736600 RepID=UPI001552B1DE|nr:DNA-processing protein DprA [Nocardioides sp. zg-DK7169]NPC95542.1 DNA-protecting protein DprA [Nocardioides sp. zg-DK7169]